VNTHGVIDLAYDNEMIFVGTKESCQSFVESQSDYFTYKVVPLTETEIILCSII